jgi:hypothetical protein
MGGSGMPSHAPFRKTSVHALLVLLLVPAPPASTQEVVPGTSAELVQLDVVVTDAKGQLVRGLTREDVDVREDGKRQSVVHFMPTGTSPAAGTVVPEQTPPAELSSGRHIDLSGLRWREADGRHHATVTLVGGLYDGAGKPVGTAFSRRSELALTRAERDRALEKGLSFQERLPLSPGRYQVKLVAREVSLAQAGGATEWVEIPDLSNKKLALSSLFVSTSGEDTDTHSLRRFKPGSTLAFQIYVRRGKSTSPSSRSLRPCA